jgi:hypothetical protein
MGNFFTCCSQRSDTQFGPPLEFSETKPINQLVDARLVALNDPYIKLGTDPRATR